MDLKPEIVIFSLNNTSRLVALQAKGIPFKPVAGCYKGVQEVSYIVNVQEDETLDLVKAICQLDGQECILKVDQARIGTLVYFDGREPAKLGKLRAVSAIEASNLDARTLDHVSNSYYTI